MINVAYGLKISGNIEQSGITLSGSVISGAGSSPIEDYTGPYTVTPSQSTQTLYTNNRRATDNITIEPIPSNFGLITWDGSVITVS